MAKTIVCYCRGRDLSDENKTLLNWLNIKDGLFDKKVRWLGATTLIALFFATVLLLIIGAYALILLISTMLNFDAAAENSTSEAIRNFGLLVVALLGAPFLVWRSVVAQKQVNVAEQGQITDRINKAVLGLGAEKTIKEVIETPRYHRDENDWVRDPDGDLVPATRPDGTEIVDREVLERTVPNLEVRIGAIYALERIAKDSLRDHLQIMEILCAYVRENAPINKEEDGPIFIEGDPRIDIQAAITVIGRRSKAQLDMEQQKRFRLDLRNTDLSRANFTKGSFSAAKFNNCRFEEALFDNCTLHGAIFARAFIRHCSFFGSELWGTRFEGAEIDKPVPGIISGGPSPFMGSIKAVSIMSAKIFALNFYGENEKAKQMFGSSTTSLPYEFQFDLDEY